MLATLFALPAIAAALPAGTMDFEKFKRMFRRNYAAGEEPVRRAIFEVSASRTRRRPPPDDRSTPRAR